jgi:superoxide dismutase, Cu-Zn family
MAGVAGAARCELVSVISFALMKKLALVSILLLTIFACRSAQNGPMAMAMLHPTSGSQAVGMVHFQQMSDGSVEVSVDLTNVPPGVHGFHIHDKGDCGDNGNAAGPHFDVSSMPHGAPDAVSHHAGDFGNVTADANGHIDAKFTTHAITVSPGARSVIGHAVILHGNRDDLTSQPAGNAGPRIACGVAEAMAGEMQH